MKMMTNKGPVDLKNMFCLSCKIIERYFSLFIVTKFLSCTARFALTLNKLGCISDAFYRKTAFFVSCTARFALTL